MNLTLAFRVAQLRLLLNGTAFANVWDNAASSPIGFIWLSLHTADPGEGTQQSSEVIYTPYARIGLVRSVAGWVVSDTTGIASPVSTIVFPVPSAGAGTCPFVGVGRDSTGPGYLFASGTISPNIIITVGTAPQLLTTSTWTA